MGEGYATDESRRSAGDPLPIAAAAARWPFPPVVSSAHLAAGGSPALSDAVVAKVSAERPDLVMLGQYAGAYGFVMHGGTAAKALQVYELQAKEFTAYWSGDKSLDAALAAAKTGMAELLKP